MFNFLTTKGAKALEHLDKLNILKLNTLKIKVYKMKILDFQNLCALLSVLKLA
ncbi:hypothetical protein SAMN05216324_11161 [Chryseobacterium limigenitum]|uniref:Uncharacterized protein n=1 Tax=Chryseobacterium limigenitum TaxID=1612149 RepID=A0A1K2ITH1_9FLAO|nr:hypothetical protein SAMN05216324_11161 [Chryseobacterium limigenitum]